MRRSSALAQQQPQPIPAQPGRKPNILMIRRRNWKLVKWATLPGKTELLGLSKDPSEQNNLTDGNSALVRDLEPRLLAYAARSAPAVGTAF